VIPEQRREFHAGALGEDVRFGKGAALERLRAAFQQGGGSLLASFELDFVHGDSLGDECGGRG
jgi:hypothetical protein